MGLQPKELIALPTMLLFVQAATRAGLSTDRLARPTTVLVQVGLQPQGQVVLQTLLQFVQVAVQALISMVLLAKLVQQDAALVQILLHVMGAMWDTSFQIRHARHAHSDVKHVQIPQCASAAVRATFCQTIHARLA
jgi:hypothetical protein